MDKIPLVINDLKVEATFYKEDIDMIFKPLLAKLEMMQKEKGERIIVFIGAPPGTGKSTLVAFLEKLSYGKVQAIGIDGFHHYDDYLKAHYFDGKPLKAIKGSPITFDVDRLKDKLMRIKNEDITWPIYSRKRHDPIEDMIKITKDIVLVEGNYLLCDLDKWRDLKVYSDLNIFIKADKDDLKDDLINRKMNSGMSKEMTLLHYQNVDGKNFDIVNDHLLEADIILKVDRSKHYSILKGNEFFNKIS